MKKNLNKIFQSLKKNEAKSMHGQLPILWTKAKDYYVFDQNNRKLIDFTSTIFVSNIGHSNSRVKRYVIKTIKKDLIHSYNYLTEIREKYLKKLVNFTGNNLSKAFLVSSGTEATEAALKIMRLYALNQKKRPGIICFEGNWHGRTMGAQLMSSNLSQKKWIGLRDPNIFHLPFPYPWKLEKEDPVIFLKKSLTKLSKKINFKKDISGVMLESFQGWGAIFYPKKFIKELEKFCKKNKILICFDEMQAGFARTGYKLGFEYYNVKPDLICCGKGMGGGFPLSGLIGKKKLLDLPGVGDMSSTHSANPVSCAAGLAVIDEIKYKNLVTSTKNKGIILKNLLGNIYNQNKKNILAVNSMGLIGAIIFKKEKNLLSKLKKVANACINDGLLIVHTGRESIKIGPPLVITNESLIKGMLILEKNINKYFNDSN